MSYSNKHKPVLHTKWGVAKVDSTGYYKINTFEEQGKRLHRLIYESVWGKLPKGWVVHHIDGDKLNNCILNLIGLSNSYHMKLHSTGENNSFYGKQHSEETKKKIGEKSKGRVKPFESLIVSSKKRNTTGYFRVTKIHSKYKKTPTFRYLYTDKRTNKKRMLECKDINGLEEKVRKNGLIWIKLDEYG